MGTRQVAGERQHHNGTCQQHRTFPVSEHHLSAIDASHGQRLTLSGGAPDQPSSTFDSDRTRTNMSSHYYAPTTDLLLQNLSMVVGNPSARCFANTPWRAFCWMCAYLAEFNRDPWGVIKDAVQTLDEITWQELMNCWANQALGSISVTTRWSR